MAALVDTAMAHRESGGLYRWEGRYLRGDDQATLIAQMRTVHQRIQLPLRMLRPELTSRQRWLLSTATLSVIGSIVDHGAKLPAIQVRALLAELADAMLAAEVADVEDGVADPREERGAIGETSKYEALLNESMQLFNRQGLPRHQHGGHRDGGGNARVGNLQVLLRKERHSCGGFPAGRRPVVGRVVGHQDAPSLIARKHWPRSSMPT